MAVVWEVGVSKLMGKLGAPYIAMDDRKLVETIADNGIPALLAAREMKRRVMLRRDPSSLLEAFEEELRFRIGED